MGIEAAIPLFGAMIQASSASHTASANAAAQAQLNKETMDFNKKEAAKARTWQANQAAIDRQFNSAEAVIARQYNAQQAAKAMNFSKSEAAKTRRFNAQEAELARDFNAEQSLLARKFEERMSSTAHQREVQDLRKAGLNPILSATGGSGASTPVAPVLSSPSASASSASGIAGSGSAASHSGSGGAAAHIGGLSVLKKTGFLDSFISSAREGLKLDNDIKRAEASRLEAEASMKNAQSNEARQKVDEKYVNQQIENLKKDNVFKDWQIKSEEEKVNLVKAEILKCAKEIEFGERVTAAREKEAGAIAYQAVKNADTEAAYKATLGKVAEAHDHNEKEQLKQKAKELKYKYEEGQNGLERDWIKKHPYWAHTLVTVDKVMSAVSPIKLRPLQSD